MKPATEPSPQHIAWLERVQAALMEIGIPPNAAYLQGGRAYFDPFLLDAHTAWRACEVAHVAATPLCWACYRHGHDHHLDFPKLGRETCLADVRLLEDCGAHRPFD